MAASTLAEVAALAGVSQATASRVLNGSARKPAEGIAERVRAAAATLGYVANAQAQALAKSSTGLIGLIVHDIADPYFSAIARGVQAVARQENRMVLLATTDGTPASEKEAVMAFAGRRAEAIMLAGSRSTAPESATANAELAAEIDRYCRNGGRVGTLGRPPAGITETAQIHTVQIPHEDLAAELARTLVREHTGEFVIAGGPAGLATSDERIRGFQRGLAEAGAPAAEVIHVAFTRDGGFAAGTAIAQRIMESPSPAPCIFACNDVMAIGVAAALRADGIEVPGRAALAGFDDIEWLRDFQPALSTVEIPLEELGRALALGAIAVRDTESPRIKGTVVLRHSTSRAS